MKCTTSLSQVKPPLSGCIAAIITRELGPVPSSIEEATVRNPLQEDDSNQAPANFLVDVAVVATTESSNIATAHSAPKGKVANSQGETVRVATLLKGLQPQREVSSKDSGKRFAAGDLAGNKPLHVPGNEVQELQFWTLLPASQEFHLGQA